MNIKKMFLKSIGVLTALTLTFIPFTVSQVQANRDSDGLLQDASYEEVDAYIEEAT